MTEENEMESEIKISEIKITESVDFEEPSIEREHSIVQVGGEGIQKIWRFKNGYGASVVRFSIPDLFEREEKIGSYGVNENLWELAVLKIVEDTFNLCYDTPITNDVVGYLNKNQVEEILKQIKKLK